MGGKPFAVPAEGTFLYFQAQRGIQETSVTHGGRYEFLYETRDIPNVSAFGIFFDGRGYAEVGGNDIGIWGFMGTQGYDVSYDQSLNELTVDVSSDRDAYRPGEEAVVSVSLKDVQGNPVSAEVNLNVVDEAFYALTPEDVDPLGELFRHVESGILATQVTQKAEAFAMNGAEGGGGGDRGRFVFKDTAAFATVVTDQEGKAQYRFTLPDNITSWRVTAQAIEPNRKLAGDAVANVDATLPFFLSPVMRNSYLDGDQPTILVRAAGTDVRPADFVAYTIRVPDAKIEETRQAAAGDTLRFDLPDLAIGPHEITVSGTTGTLKDTVTRTVLIVSSRLVKPVIAKTVLDGTRSIEGASDRLTYVTFLDGNRGRYYPDLSGMASTYGDRADEAAVRVMATELLNKEFGETNPIPEIVAQNYQGLGIRLLPYADEDFDLTAKVALFGETPFDEKNLEFYFRNRFDARATGSEPLDAGQAAKAYAALAGLGVPVLAELQRFAETPDLDTESRIYVALALHLLGDSEGARTLYRSLTKELTKELGYAYVPAEHVETSVEQTSLMAILAGGLAEPERDALADYVWRQPHGNTLIALEQLLFIRESMKAFPAGSVTVAYTLGGERQRATLERGQSKTVIVPAGQLSGLSAMAEKGTVLAVSRYETPLVDPNEPVEDRLVLRRSYAAVGGASGTSFREGDLIRVSVQYDVPPSGNTVDLSPQPIEFMEEGLYPSPSPANTAPFETYQITDVLPSGLAAVTEPSFMYVDVKGCVDYPYQVFNQRVSFFVTNDRIVDSACGNNTLTYYARVVTPGVYVAEPAYIRLERDPSIHNHSEQATITIVE